MGVCLQDLYIEYVDRQGLTEAMHGAWFETSEFKLRVTTQHARVGEFPSMITFFVFNEKANQSSHQPPY
jgi:hypothetical protein